MHPLSLFGCDVFQGVTAHLFWSAPADYVSHELKEKQGKATGREALSRGDSKRLREYEAAATTCPSDTSQKRKRVNHRPGEVLIWDLKQSVSFAGVTANSSHLPCLLLRCDAIWSVAHQRPLLPVECLMAQGLPCLPSVSKTNQHWMPWEYKHTSVLKDADVCAFAGNGLNLTTAGAVLMWALLAFAPGHAT